MRKIKKGLALSLALAMGLSLCACGDKKEESTTKKVDVAEDATMVAIPDGGEKIYAYSWNEEFGNRMQYFRDKYPDLDSLVEYVNLGMEGTSDDYKTTIGTLLDQGADADKYPSLFAADDSLAKYFLSSDNVMSIKDAGFNDKMLENMYDYTVSYATIDGELKGLTWQSTPGMMLYRADIAQDVLGVSEPDDVQALVSDWDGFFDVAQKMKDKKYYMLSGADDLKYVCIDANTTPWVDDSDTLQIGEGAKTYLENAKKAFDGGYTKGTAAWSADWYANMSSDVFCYFGTTWFLYWTLGTQVENTDVYGQWRMCNGPSAYHWGGSYIGIGKDTPNVELAALVVYTLTCDTEVMKDILETDLDYVNNKQAVQEAIDEGYGASDLLGGQNPLSVWVELAANINLDAATSYDSTFNGYLDNAVSAYNNGEVKSEDDAIQMIKDQVATGYPTIIIE